MTAAILAFVVYIAVAGLNKASELAGVVSALVALAGLGLAVGAAVKGPGRLGEEIRRPVIKRAIGAGPWIIRGNGITYEVKSVIRSTKNGMAKVNVGSR